MGEITKLYLEKIQVKSLRCFPLKLWNFLPGVTLIMGENGCGKTTLLEAIYILAHGRSFRSARDPQLVRHGEQQFIVKGQWRRFGQLQAEAVGRGGRVELRLQGSPVQRHSELMEALPVIVEAPQARRLVDGTSRERRRWLDSLLTACRDSYGNRYRRYIRCLIQWQRLRRNGVSNAGEMAAWESQLVDSGLSIMEMRQVIINELNKYLSESTDLINSELKISLKNSAPAEVETWRSKLSKYRSGDNNSGFRLGPHCDQLQIIYRGREILHTGSRGQQRLAAIALRMAEWKIRTQKRGVAPMILLDDCLEPLDRNGQKKLVDFLKSSNAQILITTPQDIELDSAVHVQHINELVQDGRTTDILPVQSMKEAA